MPLSPLPIDAVVPELLAALRRGPSAVLQAPTGAGKTSRVPPALLDAGIAGRVFVLQPRRLAARAAARRIAAERRGRVGEEVGYQVRFDKQWGRNTRIVCVTPGVLLRLLHDDPFLESAAAVVFDEFHERGLESDLALGLVRLVQQNVRPELKIIAMSATLAAESVAAYLGGCPVVTSLGRSFPVQISYEPKPEQTPWPAAVARAVERLLARTGGDVLAFLPGLGEIRQAAAELAHLDAAVLPLHGDLPAEEQDAALFPQSRRRVVLATNVAETSVTVEGITGVVDSGLARIMRFDPAVGLDRLELGPISQASADQRAGRAGRTQPGECIRLWSELNQRARAEQTEPEIRRVDLAGAVLHLLAFGETDIRRFPWLEPPKDAAVDQAMLLLRRLGAVDAAGATELGRLLSRLPVHPRLGRLLVEGQRLGDPERAAMAAALLAERDPFLRRPGRSVTESDVLDRVEALEEFERTGRDDGLNRGGARFVLRARDQLLRSVRSEGVLPSPSASGGEGLGVRGVAAGEEPLPLPSPKRRGAITPGTGDGSAYFAFPEGEALLRSLLAAYPDRLARRRGTDPRRGVLVGGRGVKLGPGCGVVESELFLAIDVDAGETEAVVRQASAVRRDWLPAALTSSKIEVEFDGATERVVARKRLRFDDLLIEESHASLPEGDEVGRVLFEAGAKDLTRVLPPEDSAAGVYLTRVKCLAQWMPELNLPPVDDAGLRELLEGLVVATRSFKELRQADWVGALQGRMTYAQIQAVEREAPERLEVPSGSRVALKYEIGRPPVLAVRIQELFGLAETPRVAAGRVRVLLHLLAPNFRPQQVTDDLASFWATTYPQVRKDLRARYPKHAWPEDPHSALPQRRPGRSK
ncbi:MAG: ATP-dependent RNA helicase [Gemmataceae bacterium]